MFSLNLVLIFVIRKQIDHKFPFKAKEDYILNMKKIIKMKKILFYSLIIYEIAFGLLAISNINQYKSITKHTLPELERDLVLNNKSELDKYEMLFSSDKIV